MNSVSEPPNRSEAFVVPVGTDYEAGEDDHGNTHWVSRAAFPLIVAAQLTTQVALAFAVYQSWIWLAVPLVLLLSHFFHGALIGFHEASHGLLRKNRLINEIDGHAIGLFSFMSFTLYRAAHQTHHMYLATERDEEMWPFVNVKTPRWGRCLAAILELNFGILFTPFLFWRMFFRQNSIIRSRKVRRRIWIELLFVVSAWVTILTAVTYFQVWSYFLWLYVAPAILAGNFQSWRKYIEHIGLHGHTAKSATRSIIADSWSGRLLSLTLLHEPLHALHHLRSGLSHHELPQHTESLRPEGEGELTPFRNYSSAIRHLLGQLGDPRVGSHWPNDGEEKAS